MEQSYKIKKTSHNISLTRKTEKMKLINRNKLTEAISRMGNNGINNMDDERINIDTTMHGEAPYTYVDAIQDHIDRREQVDEATKEIIKLADEVVDENQVEAHTKPKATAEMKKLKLAESLFEDYEDTTAPLNEDGYSELDEIDPFDLVMDTIAYTGRQVQVKGKDGKLSPRVYNGLYDADEVKPDKDNNIVIVVKKEDDLKPAIDFANKYEIEIVSKKYDKYNDEWKLTIDPYTVDMEKLYPDRDQFAAVGMNKKAGKKSITEDIDLLAKLDEFHPWGEAVAVWETIKRLDKVDDLEKVLEGYYTQNPDKKPSFEQLNDLLTFESNWIYDMLEIAPEDVVVDEDEFEYDDEVDYEI